MTVSCEFLTIVLYINGLQDYEGQNLLAVPSGGDIKEFGLKLLPILFTVKEMAGGIIGPIAKKHPQTGRS